MTVRKDLEKIVDEFNLWEREGVVELLTRIEKLEKAERERDSLRSELTWYKYPNRPFM